MVQRRGDAILIALALLILIVYWPTLKAELTFDDHSIMNALDDHLNPQ